MGVPPTPPQSYRRTNSKGTHRSDSFLYPLHSYWVGKRCVFFKVLCYPHSAPNPPPLTPSPLSTKAVVYVLPSTLLSAQLDQIHPSSSNRLIPSPALSVKMQRVFPISVSSFVSILSQSPDKGRVGSTPAP